MTQRHRQNAGVTLLELMVALAVAAIVAALGAPPLADWLARHRVTGTLEALRGDLQRARREAVLRNRPVVVCASFDGESCSAGAWSRGWIVFVNSDDDRPARRDAGERVLAVQQAVRRVALAANRDAFSFRGDLRRATNGSVLACADNGAAPSRLLVVSFTGRARIAPPGAPAGRLSCP